MLELYHTINSVCAQKVRILLEEKALAWKSLLMTLRGDQFEAAYLKLNPNAVVPTLVHDGHPVIESSIILYYLEECFPGTPLMPNDPWTRATVRQFNKLIDESVHNACTILTFAIAFRPRFQKMNAADRESYLSKAPNQTRADYKRDVLANGLDAKIVAEAIAHYARLLQWIERSARQSEYLAGEEFSLADVAVIPYIIRLDHLRLSRMWDGLDGVARWYDRVRGRPAVDRAITRSMTEADKAPFQEVQIDPWAIVSQVSRTESVGIQ